MEGVRRWHRAADASERGGLCGGLLAEEGQRRAAADATAVRIRYRLGTGFCRFRRHHAGSHNTDMAAPDRCSDVRPDRAGYPQCRQRGATDSGNTCAADNADAADSDGYRHAGAYRSGAAHRVRHYAGAACHTAGRPNCTEGQAVDRQAEDRHHRRRGCGRRNRRARHCLRRAQLHGVQSEVGRRPVHGGTVQWRLRGGEQHRRPAARSGPAPAADEPGRTDRERHHYQRSCHQHHR